LKENNSDTSDGAIRADDLYGIARNRLTYCGHIAAEHTRGYIRREGFSINPLLKVGRVYETVYGDKIFRPLPFESDYRDP
jgi:hypothetical protein